MERLCFGVSCAFVALRLLTETTIKTDGKWCELRDKMILLVLMVWRISDEEKDKLLQKLEEAEREIKALKKMRHEDAKANEKVVGIFASREQVWLNEKKKLSLQIGALMEEMRAMEKQKKESLVELQERLKEMEVLVESKDKALEDKEKKQSNLEEKLAKAEEEAQEHLGKLWKQKTALLELVSTQRQLEAELARAVNLNEAKRHEIDLALEQREESEMLAQKLSSEIMKMRKEMEKKDQILSAMPRKPGIDTAEKRMLLKEMKASKAEKKQSDEFETEKWRRASTESRKHERLSLRSMFAVDEVESREALKPSKPRLKIVGPIIHYEHRELTQDHPEVVSETPAAYSSIGDCRELGKNASVEETEILEKDSKAGQPVIMAKNLPWMMDLHALGVSYKIKRLKQNMVLLERFTGQQESKEIDDESNDSSKRALVAIISQFNKQVSRYQSLQEKTDHLCKRMHENDCDKSCGSIKLNGNDAKTTLEHFLEETFQLQRYIVATGQKLMEIQSKIASGFVGFLEDLSNKSSSASSSPSPSSCSNSSSDTKRFAESIKSLFQEIQRGLEVRIARIIGDLEGTLAREGMINLKRRGQ